MPVADALSHWAPARGTGPALREITVGDLLLEAADRWPDRDAVAYPAYDGTHWTFAEYREHAVRTARALLGSGLGAGDRVAVWATNRPEWLMLQFGAALTGIVLVPANPLYRRDEIAFVLRRSGARACFAETEHRGSDLWALLADAAPEIELKVALGAPAHPYAFEAWLERADRVAREQVSRAAARVRPEHPCQIQFTSGTTGFPKGAELHHFGLANNARLFAHRAELPDGGRHCNPMPFFHCGGSAMSTLGSLATGSCLLPTHTFDAARMVETIDRAQATSASAVPTMLLALEEHVDHHGGSLASLDVIVTGGSPMPIDLQKRWIERFGVRFTITYGATEASPVITQSSPSDPEPLQIGTCGTPLDHIEAQIVDPVTREPLPLGEQGEFRSRSRMVMRGYWGDPESTRRALDEHGWLYSGDLARMDADGYVRVTGRVKDMIIRGGENIDPAEIEAALRELDGVLDAAVVGGPDERYGEQVVAFVRATTDLTLDTVREQLADRLAPYKLPRRLELVDAFPLTPSGKVEKYRLRERLEARVLH